MREIKFRYRLKQLSKKGYEEWFEYFTIQDLEKGAGITTAEIIARDQFTGLYDKNKKEIYEGDILKIFDECYEVKTIIIDNKCFVNYGYPDKHNGPCASWSEVIGNIHENPELLKGD